MTLTWRPYTRQLGYTVDYERVRQFLLRINQERVVTPFFLWAAWEWTFCLPHTLDDLAHFSLWEDDGNIVALITTDDPPEPKYIELDPAYAEYLPRFLDHMIDHHAFDTPLQLSINQADSAYQQLARERGFVQSDDQEHMAILDLRTELTYTLPDGFTIIDQASGFDLERFNRCLWRGFDRKGDPEVTPKQMDRRRGQLGGPNQDHSLNIMVVAPNGDYAAYCGMWHEPGTTYTYVEPVCTDSSYRRLGLARAAIYESARRCAARGALESYVFSSQPFYYAIGFKPAAAATLWSRSATLQSEHA